MNTYRLAAFDSPLTAIVPRTALLKEWETRGDQDAIAEANAFLAEMDPKQRAAWDTLTLFRVVPDGVTPIARAKPATAPLRETWR